MVPDPGGKSAKKLKASHQNPLALLRLTPKNEFEGLIEGGYDTDVFGWFEEAWRTFRAGFRAIALSSLPGLLATAVSFYLYYMKEGRASSASDALFGSYVRTIIIMSLAVMPSLLALGQISGSGSRSADFLGAAWKLPGLVIIAAAIWSPLVYSGFMKELGGKVNWWAIPLAIYAAVSFSFAPYLHVDGKLGPWAALETSRRAVSRNWFGIATIYAIYYPAAWVFSAAISMIPGVISTTAVVDEMAKKMRTDPINIMLGFSNVFMAGLFYVFLVFFQIVLATAYLRVFRPVGYRRQG